MQLSTDLQKAIKEVTDYLRANSLDRETITRFVLFLEEALLVYRDDPCFDTFTIKYEEHFKTVAIKIVVPGKPRNPMEGNLVIERTLEGMDNLPVWSHRNGKNVIVYKPVLLFSGLNSLKFLWSYMRKERKSLIIAVIFNISVIALQLVMPIFAAKIITALTSVQLERLAYMAVVVLVLQLLRDLFIRYYQNNYARVNKGILDSLSATLAEKMLDIRIDTIRRYGGGLFIQRLVDDVKGLTDRFDTFLIMLTEMVQYFGILIGMAIICPPIFVYQLITYALMVWIEMRRTQVMQQDERKLRITMESYTNIINQVVHANQEIKLYRGKNAFLKAVREQNEAVTNQRLWQRLRNNNYVATRWVVREVFSCGFLLLLILFVKNNQMNISNAVVLFNYNETMFPAVNAIGHFAEVVRMFLLSCERLYQVMSNRDFPVEHFGDTHIDRLRGEISFENVSFAYPSEKIGEVNRTILNHMNLQIKPGEYVAITGRSGCGKTTIFNLITKLYETQRGVVKLDGVNIRELDEESIRDNISIVAQHSYIFHMTIRENLRVAKADATEEEMIEACKAACLHDDILRMDNGYDTLIANNAAGMSGGQRQRLAIAMCILKDTPILLMDEATSALDNITQTAIQQNITNLSGTRTIFVIAHRMSTIVNCDRILFMDDGQIIASGTHEELLKNCEGYRLLYESDGKPKNDLVDETE